MSYSQVEWVGECSKRGIASGKGTLRVRAGGWVNVEGKSGGVDGELASEPWSDTSEGVR